MKFCQKCGKELSDEAVVCPGCGCSTTSGTPTPSASVTIRGTKYCSKCGKEILEQAVVCPACGCGCEPQGVLYENGIGDDAPSKVSVILGIVGIAGGVLFAIVGHICSVISIIFGIKDCIQKKKPTGLILGIIGEVVSIFSSIIGAVIGASLFSW